MSRPEKSFLASVDLLLGFQGIFKIKYRPSGVDTNFRFTRGPLDKDLYNLKQDNTS